MVSTSVCEKMGKGSAGVRVPGRRVTQNGLQEHALLETLRNSVIASKGSAYTLSDVVDFGSESGIDAQPALASAFTELLQISEAKRKSYDPFTTPPIGPPHNDPPQTKIVDRLANDEDLSLTFLDLDDVKYFRQLLRGSERCNIGIRLGQYMKIELIDGPIAGYIFPNKAPLATDSFTLSGSFSAETLLHAFAIGDDLGIFDFGASAGRVCFSLYSLDIVQVVSSGTRTFKRSTTVVSRLEISANGHTTTAKPVQEVKV